MVAFKGSAPNAPSRRIRHATAAGSSRVSPYATARPSRRPNGALPLTTATPLTELERLGLATTNGKRKRTRVEELRNRDGDNNSVYYDPSNPPPRTASLPMASATGDVRPVLDSSNVPSRTASHLTPTGPRNKRQRTVSGYVEPATQAAPDLPVVKPSYKIGRYHREDFRQDHIISVAIHSPCTDPWISPTDPHLTQTCEGPAYSKRRMVVVMWKHYNDMFCLPLYTFQGQGLRSKPMDMHKEFACIQNVGDDLFGNTGCYPGLDAVCKIKLDRNSVVCLTAGFKVSYKEDVSIVGGLTEKGFRELEDIWLRLSDLARNDRYW